MKATINFEFHGELYVTRLIFKMMVKQIQFIFAMRPDNVSAEVARPNVSVVLYDG